MRSQVLQTMNVECKSSSTKKIYQSHINSFIKYCEGLPLQSKVIDYLNHLVTVKKYKPSSLNLVKFSLIYYFREVLKEQLTVTIPKINREKLLPKVINLDIIKRLIKVTDNFKHKIVIELLYSSGLRLSELVNVRARDLDFNYNTIFVYGKGKKERITKLSEIVSLHLKQYLDQRLNKNNPYVFDSSQRPDTHISKKTVQKILSNACKKLELGYNISPHQLRHSFATHLTDHNIDIRVIQELLGHSSPKTTMIYTKVSKERLRSVKSPMDYI